MDNTIQFLKEKFGKKAEILESNIRALQAGFNYGDTVEISGVTYTVAKARMESGTYRSIMGNQALSIWSYSLFSKKRTAIVPRFISDYSRL